MPMVGILNGENGESVLRGSLIHLFTNELYFIELNSLVKMLKQFKNKIQGWCNNLIKRNAMELEWGQGKWRMTNVI